MKQGSPMKRLYHDFSGLDKKSLKSLSKRRMRKIILELARSPTYLAKELCDFSLVIPADDIADVLRGRTW